MIMVIMVIMVIVYRDSCAPSGQPAAKKRTRHQTHKASKGLRAWPRIRAVGRALQQRANQQHVNLPHVNLRHVNLQQANLQRANQRRGFPKEPPGGRRRNRPGRGLMPAMSVGLSRR